MPVQPAGTVVLCPHQAAGVVGDGGIAVVGQVVLAVAVFADADDEEGFLRAARHRLPIAFDAPIGKVYAECSAAAIASSIGHVKGAGCVLGVNDALPSSGIAIGELKIVAVNEGNQAGRVTLVAADVGTAEIYQRIKLFDVGQPPVGVPSQGQVLTVASGGVIGQLVSGINVAVTIGVGALLPHQGERYRLGTRS